ncbi:MAG: hypothetical protein LKJ76_04115 [Lachnospiraceae bacterium]|jgi:Ca2+-binding RTX toxin-like protein|nr:hypothetical protein [Lachnospiraceae bacterium]
MKITGSKRTLLIVIIAAACAAVAAAAFFALRHSTDAGRKGMETGTGIANPFHGFDTMKDAEAYAGFTFSVPESVDGNSTQGIDAIRDQLIEVRYYDSANNEMIMLRKGTGTDNISGDYNVYDVTFTEEVGDISVTMGGNGDTVSVAYWTDGKNAFAIDAQDHPVTKELAEELVGEMK